MGISGFGNSAANIGGYFTNLHKFISPLTDYHAFYLFWWFAWSIMIGQFVARFVGGLKTWQLFLARHLVLCPLSFSHGQSVFNAADQHSHGHSRDYIRHQFTGFAHPSLFRKFEPDCF